MIRSDLARQLALRHNPQLVMELPRNHFHLARVIVEMFLLAGDFQMPATRKVAVNRFVADDLLHAINRRQGRGIHPLRALATVHRDELVHAQLHPGKDHAAVARTRAPADGLRLENRDLRATLRQRPRRGKAREASADDRHVDPLRQSLRRIRLRHLDRRQPEILFPNCHLVLFLAPFAAWLRFLPCLFSACSTAVLRALSDLRFHNTADS